MAIILLVLIIAPVSSQTVAKFQQAALYRDQKLHKILNGNFKPDLNHQLSVTTISSTLADDKFDCTFKCVNELTCKSFNLAANPDANGLYICELLATDKYTASKNDLQVSASFHHFSPQVSSMSFRPYSIYNITSVPSHTPYIDIPRNCTIFKQVDKLSTCVNKTNKSPENFQIGHAVSFLHRLKKIMDVEGFGVRHLTSYTLQWLPSLALGFINSSICEKK